MCARKMRLLYMIPICSNSVPILHRTACPPPLPLPARRYPARRYSQDKHCSWLPAGYITDPDTHREQRGPLSDRTTGAGQGFRGRPGVQGGRPGAQGPARGPGWPARFFFFFFKIVGHPKQMIETLTPLPH